MKEINIIIVVFLLLACKEQKNDKKIVKCPNTTVVTHDNFNIRFCLPEYLESYRKDSLFEGHEPNSRTDYDYSLLSNPTIYSGFMKPIKYKDFLYINFCISVDEDDSANHLLPKKDKYLKFLIEKKESLFPIEIVDSSYIEKDDCFVYALEWMSPENQYHFEHIYFFKNSKYAFSFLFEVRNNKNDNEKYQMDAKKLMQSIEIKK